MLAKDIKPLMEAYANIYNSTDEVVEEDLLTDELIEEIIEELVEEYIESGYDLDESLEAIEEAATEYLMELNPYAPAGSKEASAYNKSTTATKRGEERKAAVKAAVGKVKAKAAGAAVSAYAAGKSAKEGIKSAAGAAKSGVQRTAGAVSSAAQSAKAGAKAGVKKLLGKGLRAVSGGAGKAAQAARKVGSAAGKAASRLGEEYIDEAITSEKGKAKAAQMIANRTTASGRAKSGQGANVAQIKHIQRSNRDGLGGTPPNRKTAGSNWPKSYSGIGGTGNKAARRAAEINKEETDLFDIVLEYLVAEGYAETNENALVIMANMSEEWREEIIEGSYEDRIAANNKKYDANRKRAAQRAAARNAARDAGKTGSVPGVGYVSPRRERETYSDSSGTERHHSGAKAK